MLEEWRTSRDALEQILGARCPVASLPGGDLSPAVARSAADAGLSALFTSEPVLTPVRPDDDACWLIGRYSVTSALRTDTLRRLLGLQGWRKAQLRRQCGVALRRGFAPLYRLYVDYTTAGDRTPRQAS